MSFTIINKRITNDLKKEKLKYWKLLRWSHAGINPSCSIKRITNDLQKKKLKIVINKRITNDLKKKKLKYSKLLRWSHACINPYCSILPRVNLFCNDVEILVHKTYARWRACSGQRAAGDRWLKWLKFNFLL